MQCCHMCMHDAVEVGQLCVGLHSPLRVDCDRPCGKGGEHGLQHGQTAVSSSAVTGYLQWRLALSAAQAGKHWTTGGASLKSAPGPRVRSMTQVWATNESVS